MINDIETKNEKKYKFGDKVTTDNKKAVITLVRKIRNDTVDKYMDYIYNITFEEDGKYLELGYEDLESGWRKNEISRKNTKT